MQKPFQAYQGTEPYVFVSYAHADAVSVFQDIKALDERGLNVWYDEGITPGEEWRQELATAIECASLFLFFGSPRSVASLNCRKEVNFAVESGTPLLTVYLEETQLTAGLRLALSDVQALLRFDQPKAAYLDKLAEICRTIVSTKAGNAERDAALADQAGVVHAARVQPKTANPVIAVLGFGNLSADEELRYFSEGIAEDILNELVKVNGITVVARSSSFAAGSSEDVRQIGRQLNATHVLKGSVRKGGDRIRLSAQLIDTISASVVWSEQFDRDLVDVFDIQNEVTSDIVSSLDATFGGPAATPRASPFNEEAYKAYLQGRDHYNRLEFDEAIGFAERAIELDPNYGDAYSLLAGMHLMQIWFWRSSLKQSLPKIRYYLNMALSLNDRCNTALSVKLSLDFFAERDYQGGITQITDLLREAPSDHSLLACYRSLLWAMRRYDEAVDLLDYMISLDPLSATTHRLRGEMLMLGGRFEEAAESYSHQARIGLPDPYLVAELAFWREDPDGVIAQLPSVTAEYDEGHPLVALTHGRYLFLKREFEKAAEVLGPTIEFAEAASLKTVASISRGLCGDVAAYIRGLNDAVADGEFPAFCHNALHGPWLPLVNEGGNAADYREHLETYGLDDDSLARIELPAFR